MSAETARLKIAFQGHWQSYLLFCTISTCRCPTCRTWTDLEMIPFRGSSSRLYGIHLCEANPYFKIYDVCKDHVMKVKLIRSSKSRDVLEHECTIVIKASYKNAAYQDMFSYAGKSANIQMELYTASIEALRQRPSGSIISSTNSMRLTSGYDGGEGGGKCAIAFRTLSSCRCATCHSWTKNETVPYASGLNGTYGRITLNYPHLALVQNICWKHVMEMQFIPYNYTLNIPEFKFTIRGWNLDAVSNDFTFDGHKLVRVTVWVMLPARPSPPQQDELEEALSQPPAYDELEPLRSEPEPEGPVNSSLVSSPTTRSFSARASSPSLPIYVPRSPMPPLSSLSVSRLASSTQRPTSSRLRWTFHGTKACALIFHTRVDCGCHLCKEWTQDETHLFKDNNMSVVQGQRYGVISLAEGSETRNYHACWMHVMKMRLVLLSDLENVRLIDMQVKEAQDVRGQNRDLNWSVVMALDRDEDCWIMVEVLSLEVEL